MLVFSGTDYSPFSYEVIASRKNDNATFYLDEGIKNRSKCHKGVSWVKFPNNATEIKLNYLWHWTVELTKSNNELYFKVCEFYQQHIAPYLYKYGVIELQMIRFSSLSYILFIMIQKRLITLHTPQCIAIG